MNRGKDSLEGNLISLELIKRKGLNNVATTRLHSLLRLRYHGLIPLGSKSTNKETFSHGFTWRQFAGHTQLVQAGVKGEGGGDEAARGQVGRGGQEGGGGGQEGRGGGVVLLGGGPVARRAPVVPPTHSCNHTSSIPYLISFQH